MRAAPGRGQDMVITFFDLDQMLEEVEIGCTVRAQETVMTEPAGMIEHVKAAIHVRAVSGSNVLVCMIPIGSYQAIQGKALGDETAPKRIQDRLDRAKAAISDYLTGRGFLVRPGLIDVANATIPRGTWAGLDDALEVGSNA